jgi:hypothetical protein
MSTWPDLTTLPTSNYLRQSFVNGFIDVSGPSTFRNDLSLPSRLIANDCSFNGNISINGVTPVNINNSMNMNGIINQMSNSLISATLNTMYTSDTTVFSRLFVSQDTTLNSRLFVANNVITSADMSINSITVGRGKGNILTNTAIGALALNTNTTGTNNTALGYNALSATTTGTNNTALGSGATCSTFTQSTAIGYNAAATASNQIVLGTNIETATIPGSVKVQSTAVVKGFACGRSSGGATGTVSFGFTFANIPYITATLNTSSTTGVYSVGISSQTTTGFNYTKTFIGTNGTGGGQAGESFDWVAIGL